VAQPGGAGLRTTGMDALGGAIFSGPGAADTHRPDGPIHTLSQPAAGARNGITGPGFHARAAFAAACRRASRKISSTSSSTMIEPSIGTTITTSMPNQ